MSGWIVDGKDVLQVLLAYQFALAGILIEPGRKHNTRFRRVTGGVPQRGGVSGDRPVTPPVRVKRMASSMFMVSVLTR